MKVGIIRGAGTGAELAEVFKYVIQTICSRIRKNLEFVECSNTLATYGQSHLDAPEVIEATVAADVEILSDFYRDLRRSGGKVAFRTAINAEALYLFRQHAKAVKTVLIPLGVKKLLIVRDEMQGYYSNTSLNIGEDTVRFSGQFSKEDFSRLFKFSLQNAKSVLSEPFQVWVVYKHHLFANVLENWCRSKCPPAKLYQPNDATEKLFRYFDTAHDADDLLFITGNEVGDILHEVLLFHLGIGERSCLCCKNIYLHPNYAGLTEYQTVHGSADDIADRGIVNPFATLRCVGDMLEDFFFCDGFSKTMVAAIKNATEDGIVTQDMGGKSSTSDVVEHVLNILQF